MKKLVLFTMVTMLGLSSCMYVGNFGKRRLFLVGAADDIKVKLNGKKVDVKLETVGVDFQGVGNGVQEKTFYKHPGIKIKVRRNNKLELSSGGKTTQLLVKGKAGKGILFLVLEAPITLGIGTIVDLATVSFYYPKSKYIDVDAAFNNTSPKSNRELYKIAVQNSDRVIVTETKYR
jgi:hypothetical protein